jgi:outer membrane protein assembly factor BamB
VDLLKTRPEQGESGVQGHAGNIAAALLLFVCVVTVAFFTWQKSLDPSAVPEDLLKLFQAADTGEIKEAHTQYIYEFDARESPEFIVYKDYIVKCGGSGIWFLDKTGEVIRSEGLIFNNPIIKTNGSLILVADQGTGDLAVLNNVSIQWREKIDESILNADISEDGYVAVITTAKRDKNEVRVFESHGVELFRKVIASDFAVSANISPSEESFILSAISTGAVGAFSVYKFYDMKGDNLAELSFQASADLLPIFSYNNNGSIFAVGDRAVASIDPSGNVIWEKQFLSIAGASPVGNGQFAVAAVSEEGSVMKLYQTDGQELASCELRSKPEGLSAIRGVVCVNSSETAYFYSSKGKIISKYSTGSPIRQVCFFDKNQAAVVTDRQVAVVNIN